METPFCVITAFSMFPSSSFRFGDVTGDCVVNIDDYSSVVLNWGSAGPAGDADMDGDVDIDDYTAVVLNWD